MHAPPGPGALNRKIELADLSIADVAVEDDFVTLHIRSSMTDQEAKGEHTDIPADDGPLFDPVAAVRDWLTALHHLGIREGALFRAVAKKRGDYVTGEAVNVWVRSRAHKAGARNWQSPACQADRRQRRPYVPDFAS